MAIRKVSLFGEISPAKTHEFIDEFLTLEEKRGGGDILVLIDSEGGSVPHALALYDTLRSSPVRTLGLVVGQCLSAATLVLQGCSHRMMLPNASFMMHSGSSTTGYVPHSEFAAAARNTDREMGLFDALLFAHGKLKRSKFNSLNRKGAYLTADETKKHGFCDAVVVSRFYTKPRKR